MRSVRDEVTSPAPAASQTKPTAVVPAPATADAAPAKAPAPAASAAPPASSPTKHSSAPANAQSAVSASEASALAASYSTTVGGKSYSGTVVESGGVYTASVASLPGATASGSSAEAAENNLTVRIDVLV
jgi:hypothetical protein